MSQFFILAGQSIGASASSSVLPLNIQGWFPLGLTGLISLQSKGLKNLLQNHSSKASILYGPTLTSIHNYWKNISLTIWTFVSKMMSLLFNTLFRFVIAFLPRSKPLLLSWLQSPSTVTLEPKKIKSVTVFIVSPYICHEMMGPDAIILVVFFFFLMLSFKPAFSLSSFTFIRRLFDAFLLSAIRVVLKCCGCEVCAMLGFVTSRGEDFYMGPEMRFDYLELFV